MRANTVYWSKRARSLTVSLCGVLSAALLAAAAAEAQPASRGGDSSAQGRSSDNAPTVGEVIVTATKREERLRDVPTTVSVVTGAQLRAQGPISGTGDILAAVPGVRFTDLGKADLGEISIRGSGSERATGAAGNVGEFANGIFVGDEGHNFQLIDSFDLQRAEVLSGPQGALYGRNSEFGMVNLISRRPTFSDSGYAEADYGFETENSRETMVINHAFSDDLAVRLGAEVIQQQKGFVYNPDSNTYFDTLSGWMGRAQVRYQHNKLDVDLMVQGQNLTTPTNWAGFDVDPRFPTANYALGFVQPKYSIGQNGVNVTKDTEYDIALFANYDFGWAKLTSTTSYRDAGGSNYNGGNFDINASQMLQQEVLCSTAGVPAPTSACPNAPYYSYTNGGTTTAFLSNASGARALQSPYPVGESVANSRGENFYQDLHFVGSALDNRLDWVAGVDFVYHHGYNTSNAQGNPCSTTTQNQPYDTGTVFSGVCTGTPNAPQCDSLLEYYGAALSGATPNSAFTQCPEFVPTTPITTANINANIFPGNPFPFRLTYLNGVSTGYARDASGNGISDWGSTSITTNTDISWAPYLSLAYKLPWGFKVAGDVRYTSDHKTASQDVYQLYYPTVRYYFITGGQIPHQSLSYNHSNLSYTASVSYDIPEAIDPWGGMVYFKVGTGYRAGGFNLSPEAPTYACGVNTCFYNGTQIPGPTNPKANSRFTYAPVIPIFGDETTQSYEVGFKGNITRYVFATADWYFAVTDNGLTAVSDGCTAPSTCEHANTTYTVNGGTEHATGVELALATAPLRVLGGDLTLAATGSDAWASYVSVPTGFIGLPIVGSPVAQAPRYLASVTVNYTHRLFGDAIGFVNVVYHGQWGGYQDVAVYPNYPGNLTFYTALSGPQLLWNAPGVHSDFPLPDIQNVDLRAGLDYRRFEVAIFVKNITNQSYKLLQSTQAASANVITGQAGYLLYNTDRWSLPLLIGMSLKYRW
jgi:iron complex outermembrane receptor protein